MEVGYHGRGGNETAKEQLIKRTEGDFYAKYTIDLFGTRTIPRHQTV